MLTNRAAGAAELLHRDVIGMMLITVQQWRRVAELPRQSRLPRKAWCLSGRVGPAF